MDSIDRYFQTLRLFLPKKGREDIIRELSEEIRSQVEEREAELARPLTSAEQTAILRQFGHPLLTAARYRPQHSLIGPVVFPYYWLVLKIALGLIAVGHVTSAVVLLAGGAPLGQMGHLLENAVADGLKAAATITAVGAFAEFWLARSRVLEEWNPIAVASPAGTPHARGGAWLRPATAAEPSVSGFVFSVVLAAWWLAGLRIPYLFFGPVAAWLEWGRAMDRLYPVLVVAQLAALGEQFMRLARPGDTRISRVTGLVSLVAGCTLIYLVATSDHEWMVWNGETALRAGATVIIRLADRSVSLVELINYASSIAFILVAIAGIAGSLTALFRRSRRTPAPPATPEGVRS